MRTGNLVGGAIVILLGVGFIGWFALTTLDEFAWLEVATCEDLTRQIELRDIVPRNDRVMDKWVKIGCWK